MSNILDYVEKRIYELTKLPSQQLTDEALLLISQDHLSRVIDLSVLRQSFTGEDSTALDKFYSIAKMEEKLTTINSNFINITNKLTEFENDIDGAIRDLNATKNQISNRMNEFENEFEALKDDNDTQIKSLKTYIQEFRASMESWLLTTNDDLEEQLDEMKAEVDDRVDKLTADLSYTYGYGPIVPTILPEGKFFLQTFNVAYKFEADNVCQADAIYVDPETEAEVSALKVELRIQQVGEKIARISLSLPDYVNPSEVASIKVKLMDEYVFDAKGFTIYDGDTNAWIMRDGETGLNIPLELGVFMIPTTSTSIVVEIGEGVYEKAVTATFTDVDHGIWQSFTGMLIIPLVDENGDYLCYKDENGDIIYVSESGHSEEDPKGATE